MSPVSEKLEQIWVKIRSPDKTIVIGVLYLPPNRRSNRADIEEHVISLGSVVANLKFSDVVLQFGDYNQSGLVWSTPVQGFPSINVQESTVTEASSILLDGFSLNGMTQINNVINRHGKLLDLVLSNDAGLDVCTVSEATEPLIDLDSVHPALQVIMKLTPPTIFEDILDSSTLDFRRASYEALHEALGSIDWNFLESTADVDDLVDYFTSEVTRVIAQHVPARRAPPKPVWSNLRLRKLKRLRSKALRNYSRSRCPFQKRLFVHASNRYRLYNRFLYKRYVLRTQENLRLNPKQFWAFVNNKRKENGLPVEMYLKDETATTLQAKCNLFAVHFKCAFNNESASAPQILEALNETPSDVIDFSMFRITAEQVKSAIEKLKLSYSTGPDQIPSCILKKCSTVLIYPLLLLFNASLQQRKFPQAWKLSEMFPVFKKGDKSNIENYRGITSLCSTSKVLEIIINEALLSSCRNYISTDQHGFFPKRSVSTNLVSFVSTCLQNMDSGFQVDTVYTDLKAAFDRVDHGILLGRLEKIGMSSSFVRWFRSYLTGRSLCVRMGPEHSALFRNLSGVPQGSNLGPLLFIIFVNEIATLLPPGCRVFYADDVKIFMVIKTLFDCVELQNRLSNFQAWCVRNFLTLSVGKCYVVSFHRKLKPLIFNYSIGGQTLQRMEDVRDLGVTLDSGLTFRTHYTDIITKANKQLGFIFKISKDFRDPLCLRSLYCSLVRSVLEFGNVVWCPYHTTWIKRIEKVQKKFVKYALRNLPWLDPVNLPPYEDRCRLLELNTLEQRRFNAQAVFVAKILKGEIDSPLILEQINMYAPERRLRQRGFLQLGARNGQYGEHDPIRYMCSSFNLVFDLFDFNMSSDSFRFKLSQRR